MVLILPAGMAATGKRISLPPPPPPPPLPYWLIGSDDSIIIDGAVTAAG